jgi:hypothetical protein
MVHYSSFKYALALTLCVGICFLLTACNSDLFENGILAVEEDRIKDSIVFKNIGVDSPEFIYRSASNTVIYRPGQADQLLVCKQGSPVAKIENFVGEGPGSISFLDLYGFGSDSTVFVCGGSKYLLFDFAGNLLKSSSLDVEKSTPSFSIGQNSQLVDNGRVVFPALNSILYLDQKKFVELSHSVSCLDIEDSRIYNTGYMTPESVYLTGKFDYSAPLISTRENDIYVLYLNDPRFVYRHSCDGESIGEVPLNFSDWEVNSSTRDDDTLESRLDSYQKNPSFLQFYVSEKYILTVHIMPSEMKNISNVVEEIRENNGYRKRLASLFSIAGGDPICTIDLSRNYGVAGIEDDYILLFDINRMEESNDFALLKYEWK